MDLFGIGQELGFSPEEIQSVVNTLDSEQIYEVLDRYGVPMLGILIIIAQNDLQVWFSHEPTLGDGNCFMTALRNQIIENWALRPFLSQEHIRELNRDIKQLRKLWCQTGKGYFAG